MHRRRDQRHRAVAMLLRNLPHRHALARDASVVEAFAGCDAAHAPPERRRELAAQLPELVEAVLTELAAESVQQARRVAVLRRSDVAREPHADIARDLGLSRSQLYRDLHDGREALAQALEDRLSGGSSGDDAFAPDSRFVAIEALRAGGQYDRARFMASALARGGDAADAVRAICLRAELETESGAFAAACESVREARALLPDVAAQRVRCVLAAVCELAEFEAAHCQGMPADAGRRRAALGNVRRRYTRGAREYGVVFAKALVAETSLLFSQGDADGARAAVEEAQTVVARERLGGTRLAVDVEVRGSGIASLRADGVTTALEQSARVADAGARAGDVHALRVGMQAMSAHLLTLGRFDEAKHYALEAWALIDLFGSALDRAIVLSNLARIDVHRRDGAAALRWIEMARDVPCDAFPITQALAISHAEALVLLDRPRHAVELARAASARVSRWPRLLGRSKLAEAIALSALKRSREAGRCSADAVELSRGGGPLLELRALDLNVRLTGSATSLHALRELQTALGVGLSC